MPPTPKFVRAWEELFFDLGRYFSFLAASWTFSALLAAFFYACWRFSCVLERFGRDFQGSGSSPGEFFQPPKLIFRRILVHAGLFFA